ncbi:MAG: NADPH-dependent FMN reductase [Nitrosopumilales archaeon CG15_BIG_FIL_POST_REV_8_21_14_020_37_12]|nr:MAG: NADPH-dependent FMN reductase [Nitrosopumilales archaeon CG15_BIG_FIL_POST_REV_8_21_14_020_37_12]
MATPKILAFAGSTRVDSFNKKLVRIAATGASDAGADVTVIDLLDFPMPLYDGDLEQREGLPLNARKLREMMAANDGLLISSPEYNSSISGVLKNTIDWTSRQTDEDRVDCFKGKIAGLMSASPGRLGGLRGLVHVRAILENMGVIVIPNQVAISQANEAFNLDGAMNNEKQEQQVRKIGSDLTGILLKLNS